MEDFEILEDQVRDELSDLNVTKAIGPDRKHPAILRPLAQILAGQLSRLFNRSLKKAYLPEDWKRETVTPIYRDGDKQEADDYRPLSMISVVLKVMEKVIREEIAENLTRNGMLAASQHVFRRRRSCSTNLLCSLDEITRCLNKGQEVEFYYLDFQKVFDSVNHRLLIPKSNAYRISQRVLIWLAQYLNDRTYTVAVEVLISMQRIAHSGYLRDPNSVHFYSECISMTLKGSAKSLLDVRR